MLERISNAILSAFESIVLHEVSTLQQSIANADDIFNDVVDYSTSSYCLVSLPSCTVFRKLMRSQPN